MRSRIFSAMAFVAAVMGFMQVDAARNPASAACVSGVASWDVLNMRSGPSARYRIVGAIPANACGVRIYWSRCSGNWCKVRYAGRRGWVNMRYIDEGGDGDAPDGGILGSACVTGVAEWDVLWMRTGPSTRYRRKGKLPAGLCGITVYNQCRGNWCKVASPAGHVGWVNTRYLSF